MPKAVPKLVSDTSCQGVKPLRKRLSLAEADHRRVVGEEGHQGRQGGATRQAKHRLHQGRQQHLQQADHPEFAQQLAQGTGEHCDPHDKEHGIEQQLVRCVEQGVHHGGKAHLATQIAKQSPQDQQNQHGFQPATKGGQPPLGFDNYMIFHIYPALCLCVCCYGGVRAHAK